LSAKLLPSATAIFAVTLLVSCAKHDGPQAGSASSIAAPRAASAPQSAAATQSAAAPPATTVPPATASSPISERAQATAPGAPAAGTTNTAGFPNVFDVFTASSRKTAIVAEVDQLGQAFRAYKEKYLTYPPSMANTDTNSRKAKFMRHVRTTYPSSAYGVRAVDFDKVRDYVQANYKVRAGEKVADLDLLQLDPAEALVFWLGGFPMPVGQEGTPIAPKKLFGFNKDFDSPLKRVLAQEGNEPLATRSYLLFDFDQKRLVDQDADGWWEYLPTPPKNGAPVAPFVYFDYDVHGDETKPAFVAYPTDAELAAKIGTAVPLAAYFDPTGKAPTRWQNPSSFQILCGGLDGKYSSPKTSLRVTIFPSGRVYLAPNFSDPPGNYDPEELDNLTNLVRSTLGEARAEGN
jgi:hypothetical protein